MPATIALPPSLDVVAAGDLLAKLKQARGTDVVLDASQVERLSGPCLQVLIAARRRWIEDGRAMEFHDVSIAMVQALEVMDATRLTVDEGNA